MNKGKKYIKKSADGRFFLYIDKPEYSIGPENKTKLWTSSSYLLEESLREDKNKTIEILDYLIKWNESNERFEDCSKLIKIRRGI